MVGLLGSHSLTQATGLETGVIVGIAADHSKLGTVRVLVIAAHGGGLSHARAQTTGLPT